MNGVNLIPGQRLAARRREARLRMWMCIAPACVMLLSGSYGYLLATWETSTRRVQEQLAALAPVIDGTERENADYRRRLNEARDSLLAARAIGEQPDWGRLIAYVAQKLGEGAVLTDLVLDPAQPEAGAPAPAGANKGSPPPPGPGRAARYRLTLSGLALTQEAVTQLALGLTDPALFSAVKLVESKRSSFSGAEAVSFRIECSIDEQGGRGP